MFKPQINWIFLFPILVFLACEKQEIPIQPHESGDVITNSVKLENDYRYQVFFDLETNKEVARNLKTEWDLAFDCSANSNKVLLNSAKYMRAANTLSTNFAAINDTTGYVFKIDMPSGNIDSTAIGNWTPNNVYIIERGFNELGQHLGFCKFEIIVSDANQYQVHFAKLDGTNDFTMIIPKDNDYNFSFLSFAGSIKNIEPPKEDWDLMFTQYTHYFSDTKTSYLVTGCVTNRHKVLTAQVFNKPFENINLDDVNQYVFYNTINKIGYNWKEYNYNTGVYEIFYDMNYIIKSTEEKYFKLHFIDFYDTFGVKGTPVFEFQEL